MAYDPLHLKYRPQRFADVVGQGAVVKTLANAIRLGRIAPAYLFCGPRGTGKTSSARILAKSLNCIQGPTADPCNVCEQCVAITTGSSLDVIEIDAASNTGVDNIRELIERAQFAPVNSRYKVYVLDEVHMLSTAAFNALLKTLEEPPEHVVFILATTDPQRVLPTVISRCQRFDYRRIPLEDMTHHLSTIAQQERILIQPEAIELIAQLSQGGLRDAESLLDQLSLLDSEIRIDEVWDLVGAVPERQLLQLIDALQRQDPEQVLTLTRQLLDHGKEPLSLLQNLASFYRDLLLAKSAPQRRDLVALTQSTWDALQQRAPHYSTTRILAVQTHIRQAEPQIRQSNQPRLWLEITLLDLLPLLTSIEAPQPQNGSQPTSSTLQPTPLPVQPISSRPAPQPVLPPTSTPVSPPLVPTPQTHQEASPVSPTPAPAIVSTISVPPSSPTSVLKRLSDHWDTFIQKLPPVPKGRIRVSKLAQESANEIVFSFPTEGFAKMAREKESAIQPVLEEVLGRSISLKFTVEAPGQTGSDSPIPPEPVVTPDLQPVPVTDPIRTPDPTPSTPDPLPTAHSTSRDVAAPPAVKTPLGSLADGEELDRATQQFADFFNGVIVQMDDFNPPALDQEVFVQADVPELTPDPDPVALTSASPQPSIEDEDIPF